MEQSIIYEMIIKCSEDLFGIHITAIGVCISVITLLYSFITSKKADIDSFSDQLKHKDVEPLIAQRYGIATRYIKQMERITRKIIFIIILSTICTIGSWLAYRVFDKNICLIISFIIINIISIFEFALFTYCIYRLYKQFKKDTYI